MAEKIRVAFVTSEISPYARSTDLGDFCSILPAQLSALGVEPLLFLPRYRLPGVDLLDSRPILTDLQVPLGTEKARAVIHKAESGESTIYLVENPKYFLRESVYGAEGGSYLDNDERFIFFCRAVVEFLRGTEKPPDIIHCHDWPTALVPVLVKAHYGGDPRLRRAATILTLHHPSVQGEFPAESLALTGLDWNSLAPGPLFGNGKFNFLRAGILFADLIAVSAGEDARSGVFPSAVKDALSLAGSRVTSIPGGADGPSWERAGREYQKLYRRAIHFKFKKGDSSVS